MLMTVLRGDLAIKQSKILIRLFKTMKDFIIERENLIGSDEVARLAIQTSQNTKDIARIDKKLSNVTTKDDVVKIIEDFSNHEIKKDFLFMNGKSVEADLAYQQIYAEAKKTNGILHDRYIILDFGTKNEKIYHCGASSKDAGNKVCSISSTADHDMYKPLIENLLTNPELVL
jgi:K+-sensing histidine kinase KdpD